MDRVDESYLSACLLLVVQSESVRRAAAKRLGGPATRLLRVRAPPANIDLWGAAQTLLAAIDAQSVVDAVLAPFATIGIITGTTTTVAAFAAKVEVEYRPWDAATADAYVQGAINDGLAAGGAIAFWPVVVLIADALT